MAAAAAAPLVGELRMSVIPTIAPFLLPGLLPRLRKERPSLKLFLREEPSAQACESLHHGMVDCVLLALRSEEHTSELQSLMRISYAVFCLKTKTVHAPIRRSLHSG